MIPHWDLIPGEYVTLASPGQRSVVARLLFRDTIHACFEEKWAENLMPRFREFVLREDGTFLQDGSIKRIWHVVGERKSTAAIAAAPIKRARDRIRSAEKNT